MSYATFTVVALTAFAFTAADGQDATASPVPWISDLFYRALADFAVRDVGTTACRKQTELHDRHLRNHTSWAVHMAESWDRRPIGILTGNSYHLGIYDECINVHYPVRGQYCLANVKLTPPTGKVYNHTQTENLHTFDHVWDTVLKWVDYPDQVTRNSLYLGICIPDSCSASDLQMSLQNQLDETFPQEQIKATVKVNPLMCTISGNMYPQSTAFYVTCMCFAVLVLLCVCATLYHFIKLSYHQIKKQPYELPDSIFNSFSFIKSMKELLKFDKNNELNLMNGFKVLVMIFILFGHRFMYLAGNPLSYSIFVEKIYQNGPDILLTCMNLVDPFFFLSGFLMYIMVGPIFKKPGSMWMKFISPIVYRIVRMLPPYCAMIAITAHIVPHLGDGPLWSYKIWDEAEKCQNYWWLNLLFINNLIDVKYQCLLVSWYISCDIQFFIIGLIIVYVYTKNTKYGVWLLSTTFCLSFFLPFIVTYMTGRDGILKVHIPFLENPRTSTTFNESYRPSYMRATPFIAGIAVSFIIAKLKEKKFKLSQVTIYCGTAFFIVFSVWIQLYGAIFYSRHRSYNPIEQALYSTLSHCSWSLLGVWISVCHFTSGYGPLEKVFNNRLMVPLGRLSYSVFLVNLVVMMMSQDSLRVPIHPSAKNLVDAWIYDSFKSYLMATMLYLVVEAPFGNLSKQMFGRGQKKNVSNTNETLAVNNVSRPETLTKGLSSA